MQQISESELVLMKIIWKNGGTALYSYIMEELEKDSNEWKKNTVLTLLSRLIEKDEKNRQAKRVRRGCDTAGISDNADAQLFGQGVWRGR